MKKVPRSGWPDVTREPRSAHQLTALLERERPGPTGWGGIIITHPGTRFTPYYHEIPETRHRHPSNKERCTLSRLRSQTPPLRIKEAHTQCPLAAVIHLWHR